MDIGVYIELVKKAAFALNDEDYETALRLSESLIEKMPGRMGSYLVAAQSYVKQDMLEKAEKTLLLGIKRTEEAQLILNLGVVLSKQEKYQQALERFASVSRQIKSETLHFHYAKSLVETGRIQEGINQYTACLEVNPYNKAALNNIANAYQRVQQFKKAIKYYQLLLNSYPNEAMGYNNLGGLHEQLNQTERAAQYYQWAIEKKPSLAISYYNLGALYASKFNDHEKAQEIFRKGLENGEGPFLDGIRLLQISSRQHLLDWSHYEKDQRKLNTLVREYVADPDPAFEIVPYDLGYAQIENGLYKKLAEKYAGRIAQKVRAEFPNISFDHRSTEGKIKIGYYSPNFRMHPGGTLVRSLFEHHDASEFEIHAFSLVHQDDMINRDIQASVDYYHDVSQLTSLEIANLINRTGIDILVSLAGYNSYMKMDVMAMRPAPIQMILVGSHETTGASFVDYAFSDEYMMDQELRENFTEQMITLPCSLLLNSGFVKGSSIETSRSDHGLSEDKIIYAAFNHPRKLSPSTFDAWLEVLRKVLDSELWIYDGGNEQLRNSLVGYAKGKGVRKERFVFASHTEIHHHWERLKHADIFLDNFAYSAHVTGLEALSAGKPIVSLRGDSHNRRLCASLLHYSGLDSLIANTVDEFIKIAIDVATKPGQLKEINKQLMKKNVVFDTALQVKFLENAYKMALHKYAKTGQKEDFFVKSAVKFDSFA